VLIFFGVRGPSYLSEDRYPSSLINVILGANSSSRLLVEIREKLGLAYSVGSYASAHQDVGLMQIFSGVAPDKTAETLDVIRREIRRLKREPVSHEELAAAKEYIKGVMYLQAENSDHRMTRLAKNEMYLGRVPSFGEILDNIEKITSRDLMAFAGELFDAAAATLLLYGPVEGQKEDFEQFLDI
jgi:predicted Zn-dependent peptidase